MEFVKPKEWGSRFQFPENQQINFDCLQMSVTDKIVAQMVDNYETAVAAEIAQAARAAGASDVTVLDKAAIIDALMKRTPRKYALRKYDGIRHEFPVCPTCGADSISYRRCRFCPDCGQAIDWRIDDEENK